uniref:F-box domain-containing protein n=1 Tax=Tanacetum cinerariifolium TaxID=118510 RepID=A0A699HWU8_TANCI|nr:hypothetical protein [Tanacetum cinerariifolium]
MSDNIPFDLQLDIMNRLPVKSLLQFRTVSKQWKFSIDNFDLIRKYDMPEQVGVWEFFPPYYISQLGESLIIFGSFDFGDCRVIYAWALEVDGGSISSCRLLFIISHPTDNHLKLLGFSKDKEPIVEATIVQQWYRSLQVCHPIIQYFQNIGAEANRDSFFIGPYKESLILHIETIMK